MRLIATFLYITFLKGLFFSQNEINLTKTTHSISIDNIADYVQSKIFYSVTNLRVDRNTGDEWDLTVKGRAFTPSPYNTSIGTQLNSSNLAFKATNICLTPDIFINPNLADANNISTQSSGLAYQDLGNPYDNTTKYYIVGTSVDDDPLTSVAAGCGGTLNNDGTGISNPQTHSFNIDIELDLTAFLAGTSYTPGLYTYEVEFELFDDGNTVASVDQAVLTIEVDILPILQIKTSGLNELSFDFTDMSKYNTGITHYGATIIEINSNTEWDLLAIGTSSSNENGSPYWDVVTNYSLLPSGSSQLPLSALELYQTPPNPKRTGAVDDYSAAFASPPSGNNNIEVATTGTFIPVAVAAANPVGTNINKAIAGRFNSAGAAGGNAIEAGSYLVSDGGGGGWDNNDFRFIISYKITPGMDATFSNGLPPIAAGSYVNPGAYSMQVKYLLTTDQ